MDLNLEVAYYIIRFHSDLMTETERKARLHLLATMKASKGCSDVEAQLEARKREVYSRALSSEPRVVSLARRGFQQFQLTTAARVLKDSADKVFFNICPACGKLARTPSAKQCRHCGLDWHGEVTGGLHI